MAISLQALHDEIENDPVTGRALTNVSLEISRGLHETQVTVGRARGGFYGSSN